MVCVVQAVGLQGLVAEGEWATECVVEVPCDRPSPSEDAYL